MKKLFAFVLSLVMVLSLCAACGGNQTETPNTGDDNGKSVALNIGLSAKATVLDYENNSLTKWVEEQTGFDLSFQPYSGGDEIKTQIASSVAAQQALPDILFGISLGGDDVAFQYGRDGYFVNLKPYFDDRDGASKVFWDRIEEVYSEAQQKQIINRMTDPNNGEIYAVPTLDTSLVDTIDYQMWINTEWLDKLDLPMPTDPDSLYNTLVAFRDNDPNGNGKKDEIPLYGSQEGYFGADVINWLVNMFVYFDDVKHFNVDEDGQLYTPFTTDKYREALQYINKLLDEGLMLETVFNTQMGELKAVITPASGVAQCGIFAGHLSLHADCNSEIMKQYQPLPGWGSVVFRDDALRLVNFITTDCENPDEAFELMMTLFSEEASYRLRYGEYGVNWTDADEGAESPYGLPAKIKILRDPLMEQNTCVWSGAHSTLVEYSEGEAAQVATAASEGDTLKAQLHAASRVAADAAAAEYNPPEDQICPALVYTAEEKEAGDATRKACADYYMKSRTDFCTGVLDPNSDAVWQKYLDTLEELGVEDWVEMAQVAYDRR